jgi:hypothetical protein
MTQTEGNHGGNRRQSQASTEGRSAMMTVPTEGANGPYTTMADAMGDRNWPKDGSTRELQDKVTMREMIAGDGSGTEASLQSKWPTPKESMEALATATAATVTSMLGSMKNQTQTTNIGKKIAEGEAHVPHFSR